MKRLLPTDVYSPGTTLPPHLSPFVEEQEGDYVPPERQAQLAEQEESEGEEGERDMETGTYVAVFHVHFLRYWSHLCTFNSDFYNTTF